jgi:hypothetical protein
MDAPRWVFLLMHACEGGAGLTPGREFQRMDRLLRSHADPGRPSGGPAAHMSDHRSSAGGAVPPPPGWAITRLRPLERLRRGARGPLTVVTGPPGAGRTTAVNTWAATRPRSSGPIAGTSGDRTPETIEGWCADPLERLSHAEIDTGAVAGRPPRAEADALTADVAALPARLHAPLVVVIDGLRAGAGLRSGRLRDRSVEAHRSRAAPGHHLPQRSAGPAAPVRAGRPADRTSRE